MIPEQLKTISILSSLNQFIVEKQFQKRNLSIDFHSRGTTIYNQNEPCDTLDFVISGSLISYHLSINGSETVMFEFRKNSMIGANILFGDNNIYPLNIYCLENSNILRIKKEAVIEFLHNHEFVMNYIKSLSENSIGMNQKIAMFSKRTLRENIIIYLKEQSVTQKSKNIFLPISKKELSDYLGVQRPSLFRELKKMKDERLISIENHNITINF